jgi:hypothetical protein
MNAVPDIALKTLILGAHRQCLIRPVKGDGAGCLFCSPREKNRSVRQARRSKRLREHCLHRVVDLGEEERKIADKSRPYDGFPASA